jgi:TRAP-type C4-dicarboxylate transport system substrate-binding protein
MKKSVGIIVLMVSFFLAIGTFSTSTAAQKVYKWRVQAAYPLTSAAGSHSQRWADAIEDMSNGRIKMEVFSPGALCSVKDIYAYVSKGVIDASVTYGGFYTGLIPETDLMIGLPLSHQEWSEVWDVMYRRGLWRVIQNGFDKQDLLQFPIPADRYYNFMTTFPVNSIDDFKGKKIRALGVYGKYAQALGASATVVPGAEMYMALKLGTIDGAIYGTSGIQDVKLHEVVDYYVFPTCAQICISLVISKKSLNKLPEDLKNLVIKASPLITADTGQHHLMDSVVGFYKAESEGKIKRAIFSETDLAKMRKLVKPIWEEMAAKSPNMKKGVEIIKQQMRDLNRPMD